MPDAELPVHSPLRAHPRSFYAAAGRRGRGRPKLSEEERAARAIARLERKLAALKQSAPCRTHPRQLVVYSKAHPKNRKHRGISRPSARRMTDRKAER